MFKNHRVTLYILHFEANGIITCGDACLVGVGEVAHQTVVVEFEVIIIEVLLKHGVGSVGCVHHEVDFFDVISSKGVPHFNRELHLSEGRAVVGRPFELLCVVPVAAVDLVATVDPNAGTRKRVGHDLETGISTGTFHLSKGDVHRTVGLAEAAGVAFARGLSVDADFELLSFGHHETVGTDVKLNFNDAP